MADVMHSEAALDPEPSSSAAVLDRRIEFHLARKTYNGFSNNRSFGFNLVTLNPNSEHDKVSELAVKREMPKVSENLGLDPELSLGITFRRIGAGLRNLGNTCFLNSVLQCLTYTEPLAAYLQSGRHQYSCRTAGFCALCAIQKHVSRALQSTGRILEPKDLVSNLRCISRSFRNARQEDAHEYMVNLLESMHKCCLPSGVPSESHTAYEKSLVHKIFGGRLRSQVKCMQCSFCSNKFDPFLDLSLEIAKADSLHKALAHFTAKEFLDGGARQYQCQECKQKVKALKQLTIHKAPHVLTIHLKRFGSHIQGQKIDKKISFSPNLDLKPFVTGPDDEDLSYTLYGVLVHAGWSTHSGHYYCFVRTSSGMWYSLDDNQVVQVNERKVLEQKAYMLFYVRDRKNCSTKKPVAVVQKENKAAMNAIENVVNFNINQQLMGKIPNGSIDKKSDGSIPVALSDRGTLTVTSLKEPPKRISFQNVNCSLDVDHVSQRRDAQLEPSSSVPPVKDSVDCCAANCNSSGSRAMLGSTCEVSYCNRSLGDAPKIIGSQKGVSAVQDLNASAMQLPNCNLSKDSVNKKEPSEFVPMPPPRCYKDTANENHGKSADQPENSSVGVSSGDVCSIAATNLIMCDSTVTPTRTIEEASNKKGYSNFAKRSRIEEAQVQGSPGNVGDPTSLETHGGVQKGTDYHSKFSLHLPATSESLPNGISNNKVPQLKVKGKLFKCQVSRMSLSSNMIFGVAFALQKQKQKQRRRKYHSLQYKNPNLKQLRKIDSPSDLVQSNSDKSLPLPDDHDTHSERERADYRSNDGDKNSNVQNISCNGNVIGDVNDDGRGEKVGQNGAMHATVNPSQLRKAAVQGPDNSEKERRASRQNGIAMTMLEETTVARWDGINVFLPENMKPKSEPSQIGYIGDEWDEEYDRGKRKKIRGPKISFDEPNLFQEIATRNAKLKRAKLHPSNSGNQPFRI
ncbi:uncharacterized protein LOC142504740 [Primulina tabacum]|uniref:uncharacterized protein LOC142504740 n=1 Tax=Primulina tabacum TaxID=48773 RepID=UPI003F59E8D3